MAANGICYFQQKIVNRTIFNKILWIQTKEEWNSVHSLGRNIGSITVNALLSSGHIPGVIRIGMRDAKVETEFLLECILWICRVRLWKNNIQRRVAGILRTNPEFYNSSLLGSKSEKWTLNSLACTCMGPCECSTLPNWERGGHVNVVSYLIENGLAVWT